MVVVERVQGLAERQRQEVAALERRVVAADGGRLKLEHDVLASRPGDRVLDLLVHEGGALVGFLGLYPFGRASVELAGMVDPGHRRRGVATALLDAATPLVREWPRVLLVVPGGSAAGHALARRRGGVPHHAEHALVLDGPPAEGPADPALALRPAGPADAAVVARLLAAAFDEGAPDEAALAAQLASPAERTLLVEHRGAPVGTLRLTSYEGTGGVYGFAVDPGRQGRGIGRDALRRACALLRAEGARRVALEVAVGNDRALGLYTSLGFRPVAREDYYALPVPA
ncbi:GNAT family N-acetyltransferase [Vallicoccus soli]|uniref:GNAT family N-acetyltransferase n=1 Tax=Vallicoccus soli TaxID=2339232 RepID=UPI001C4994DC|nr:GNAT family N-acetyltransferase [Vallicoccus soli]